MEKTTLTYNDPLNEDFIMERLADTDELQLNFIRLKAGKFLPAHNANSNVRLITLDGQITVTTNGNETKLGVREVLSVNFGTPMQISNPTNEDAAFLVIKAPNPRVMG